MQGCFLALNPCGKNPDYALNLTLGTLET